MLTMQPSIVLAQVTWDPNAFALTCSMKASVFAWHVLCHIGGWAAACTLEGRAGGHDHDVMSCHGMAAMSTISVPTAVVTLHCPTVAARTKTAGRKNGCNLVVQAVAHTGCTWITRC